MIVKSLGAGLLGALIASSAMAQAQPGNTQPLGSTDAAKANTSFITQMTTGHMRASDLIGQDVVDAANKDIGEIEDVVLDRSGKIVAFVIEFDDLPGIGDREIAVPLSAIQIDPADSTATTGNIQGSGTPRSTDKAQQNTSAERPGKALVPSRVVLTMPMEQLKSAPAFDHHD
jgi:sporulation protein YlmC with PRC-barrel domain